MEQSCATTRSIPQGGVHRTSFGATVYPDRLPDEYYMIPTVLYDWENARFIRPYTPDDQPLGVGIDAVTGDICSFLRADCTKQLRGCENQLFERQHEYAQRQVSA